MSRLNRRNFLATLASGVAGLGIAGRGLANPGGPGPGQAGPTPPKIGKYNPLGKTGLKVSDVSFGAISLYESNVLRYAHECGVNYFDTAEGYLRGRGEILVSQGLKEVRDKVIITTKHPLDFRQKIDKGAHIKRVEESLKRLQSDYIDITMAHGIDELLSAYDQLKKDGKVRFTGFSTHNAKVTLKQALDTDFAQVVLVMYNHMEGKEIEPLLKAARQKGIGTVAMKIFAGGMQGSLKSMVGPEVSYPQAAIRWVMSNPDIDTCIPTFSSYSHVEEYVAASGKPLDRAALALLGRYSEQAHNLYCRVSCTECLSACPRHVAVNDVLRYAMYFENYRMERMALDYYAAMAEDQKPVGCAGCAGYCEKACPYGLEVKPRLRHAHDILSA
jgi:predicted aldo/keto reductase-like oxidoreductase